MNFLRDAGYPEELDGINRGTVSHTCGFDNILMSFVLNILSSYRKLTLGTSLETFYTIKIHVNNRLLIKSNIDLRCT
jgi:hypothetical protein